MPNAEALDCRARDLVILWRWSCKQAAMSGAAHQHDILDGKGEGADVHLRDVSNKPGALADRQLSERRSIDSNLSGKWRDEAHQSFEQCRLASAIRAEKCNHLTDDKRNIKFAADNSIVVADGQIASFKDHDQLRCASRSRAMKKGVPTTAVKMPRGISTGATVRASVSMISK